MPPANRDSSELTRRRAAKTLYGWNNENKAAVIAGTSVLREQPNTQLLSVVTQRKMGGCYCGPWVESQAPGSCGCRG
jgi:hypothetical protein